MSTNTMTRHRDYRTSIVAAERLKPRLSELQTQVLAALRQHREQTGQGLTDRELERLPDFAGCAPSTIRKRRGELASKKLVKDSGQVRDGMIVWWPLTDWEVLEELHRKMESRLF